MKKIIIVGGGISGLISSIQFARAGIPCVVIEKKAYPFHRVCGEYISAEAIPFLKSLSVYPEEFNPPIIKRFQLSSVRGNYTTLPLDMGGFGISRYSFDHYLFQKAKAMGVDFMLDTEVESINFQGDKFDIKIQSKNIEADMVLGSFGKRSKIDIQLKRNFTLKRSPYVGVKYHLRTEHPNDLIALHNFKGGYCGMSNIEDNKTNLCYLTHRSNLKQYGNIEAMEKEVLFKNPLLKTIFTNADFIFPRPEVINEISFETKSPIENHILMVGDAAGMITPLCGNGMAMAVHSAKLASELVIKFYHDKNFKRSQLEKTYTQQWQSFFTNRLWKGRQVQRLFGNKAASQLAVNLAIYSKPIARAIIRSTHGQPF